MDDKPENPTGLAEFLAAYIECALWSSMDGSNDQGGSPLDDNYDEEDIAAETLAQMREDCRNFLRANASDIGDQYECAGCDFWLTRNHHGDGFWDGGWPKDVGERLTQASHAYGSVDLCVGDDGKIYG